MRESCSCGAGIVTLSYRKVKEWRSAHLHTPNDPARELEDMVAEEMYTFLAEEEENE